MDISFIEILLSDYIEKLKLYLDENLGKTILVKDLFEYLEISPDEEDANLQMVIYLQYLSKQGRLKYYKKGLIFKKTYIDICKN